MLLGIGVVGLLLSFGPAFPPYGWLDAAFPPLAGIRGAARFGYLALAAVAGLAGFGLAAVRRPAVAVLVIALANLEALRAPIVFVPAEPISPVYERLAAETDAVVAEFPFYPPERIARNAPFVYASTAHWKPLLNGYSGFTPASYVRRAETLAGFPDDRALAELRAAGVTHVVVHTDQAPGLDRALQAIPALTPVSASRTTVLFRLR